MGKKIQEEVGKKNLTLNVKEEIFALSPRSNGSVVRLDLGAWGSGNDKYELRIWKEIDGTSTATKGLGMTGAELKELRDKLNELEFD